MLDSGIGYKSGDVSLGSFISLDFRLAVSGLADKSNLRMEKPFVDVNNPDDLEQEEKIIKPIIEDIRQILDNGDSYYTSKQCQCIVDILSKKDKIAVILEHLRDLRQQIYEAEDEILMIDYNRDRKHLYLFLSDIRKQIFILNLEMHIEKDLN